MRQVVAANPRGDHHEFTAPAVEIKNRRQIGIALREPAQDVQVLAGSLVAREHQELAEIAAGPARR